MKKVPKPMLQEQQFLTDVYGFGSLVADLFFKIKIEQGKGLE